MFKKIFFYILLIAFNDFFISSLEKNLKNNITINIDSSNFYKAIILIVILLVILLIIIIISNIIINVFFLKKAYKKQQQYFEYAIRAIQHTPSNLLSIPMTVPYIETRHKPAAHQTEKAHILPEKFNQNIGRISKILESCNPYANEIDIVTHRKNCSKNVAELVYKISKHLGYDDFESMLYYAVGLVYDIGFLNIDPVILEKSRISEEEYEIIKTHTVLGINLIHFIDNDLKSVFTEGISKHHENLDGTGYPKGLAKNDIPYIARVIRVVESFISLISKREYKEMTDKEHAIADLYKSKTKYDKKILDALNEII